ncbi:hypothetical protein Y032_0934g3109 [Ancylostoma ceylanicum]|uniref:Uncharacterized protein n=1 Tax=Ancylostoma ceylanicum TaxID=53326 RepID=A0A016W942_9BILA|nr:hypothetical protein Y032_0934g3109 [Ancylostoma ceylanicum]
MIHIPAKALSLYSESRVKDAHTIIDLAMYNYEEVTRQCSFWPLPYAVVVFAAERPRQSSIVQTAEET